MGGKERKAGEKSGGKESAGKTSKGKDDGRGHELAGVRSMTRQKDATPGGTPSVTPPGRTPHVEEMSDAANTSWEVEWRPHSVEG